MNLHLASLTPLPDMQRRAEQLGETEEIQQILLTLTSAKETVCGNAWITIQMSILAPELAPELRANGTNSLSLREKELTHDNSTTQA